jgi:hypothetical protein
MVCWLHYFYVCGKAGTTWQKDVAEEAACLMVTWKQRERIRMGLETKYTLLKYTPSDPLPPAWPHP